MREKFQVARRYKVYNNTIKLYITDASMKRRRLTDSGKAVALSPLLRPR